ncbi:transcription termination factor [Helicobacter mustelae 12198]|uniref:Transcription termination/antitermination protein NusA n=1 Tax=Helicobacter mustelae (strain ATCC 43772 / CCUG 25715 / CIP 103759 / LMG 18044 / NCTC 12198 / R85-136P) TaxID=679897 RepID=D3UFX4_HELM1|nr:transcription termination factor [Helicobacter mustelae 12198]
MDIIEIIAYEKGIPYDMVLDIVKNLIIKTAKQEINEEIQYSVEESPKEKTLKLIHNLTVCSDEDEKAENDKHHFIALKDAKNIDASLSIGDIIKSELTLENMSRGTVNKIFQDLEYQLQRSMEEQLFKSFKEKIGKIVSGVVLEVDAQENTFIEIHDIRAILPLKNRIKGERFQNGDTISAILKFVKMDKNGIYLELSRTTPKMLEELLMLEVPEIKDGEVIIQKTARIPGDRAKVAVFSTNPKIDAIGSTVGVKGVRINAVGRQLNGENIDCIEYSDVPEIFITRALAPANIINVQIKQEELIAKVKLMASQKSKAIGKNGVNIRLVSMLTGYNIEIEEIAEEIKENTKEEATTHKLGIGALESLFKN